MPLNILINGAGVGGPAVATALLRSNPKHKITIMERAPELRRGGQQIDLRAQGIPVMQKLGLLDAVRSKTVAETGLAFIDSAGKQKAYFGVNDSGKGQQAIISEYEIMRGDLVDVLVNASKEAGKKADASGGSLAYQFDKYATDISQNEHKVQVTFSDSTTGSYDLVIGADGQGSRTRRLVFGNEEQSFKPFGLYVAFFSIPRTDEDDQIGKCYHTTDRRVIVTRTGDRPVTQVYLAVLSDSDELQQSSTKPVNQQKELWTKLFQNAGWQTERFLAGLQETKDFYAQPIGQVKMEHWTKGRVVLVGDAGYCPSPITGMGTTASLVGAFVLAGELSKHEDNVPAALKGYEDTLRPFINEAQKFAPGTLKFLYPVTQWGVTFLQTVLGAVSWLQVDKIVNKLTPENKGGWELPYYPELHFDT